ncbi:MAG: hypothetical protein K0S76_396 [Herbinix sp.]|jgi:hypothetical protein|nr:hypothetical protein [Herbinix sp.]
MIIKGCDSLSKQSNQRYRKEMEKKNVAGNSASNVNPKEQSQDKINYREFNSPTNKTEK